MLPNPQHSGRKDDESTQFIKLFAMSAVRCPSCGMPAGGGRFCGTCGMRLGVPTFSGVPSNSSSVARLLPGTVLASRYRIVSAVAAGSMGSIYRADDLRVGGRPRAIKELLQNWGADIERAEAETWFQREGETLKSLQHPAIPLVYDTFSEGQRHYLVMDFVEGRTLEQVLVEEGRPGLPQGRVLNWAEQVLDVLSFLHSRSDPLIFRDLKPANLMLTPRNEIRLIDFGIARVFTRQAQGTAIGTPGYAPPEQYQGLAEPASDLYALGATMHHLLTGRDPRRSRPFDFPPVRSLAPDLDPGMATAIDRALSLDPRARYGTAADLRRALRGTSSLDTAPKLTISGVLARSGPGSGAMPALPGRSGSLTVGDPAATAMVPVGPRAVRLKPREMNITFAGKGVVTRIDRRTLHLRNRTNKRLLLSFDASVPWLRPDRPAAWLEPYGKVQVALGIDWSNTPPPAGVHSAVFAVKGGQQQWTLPVRLHVRGSEAVAVTRLIGALSMVASLCIVAGVLGILVGAVVDVQMIAFDDSWHVLLGGIISRALLRKLQGSQGA